MFIKYIKRYDSALIRLYAGRYLSFLAGVSFNRLLSETQILRVRTMGTAGDSRCMIDCDDVLTQTGGCLPLLKGCYLEGRSIATST